MIEILINIGNILCPIFYKIVYMSIVGTALGVLILTITKLFDNKLSAKVKCLMLVIPILFLLIPINRIEMKTDNDFVISSAIDKVESTLSTTYTEKSNVQNSNYETVSKQQYKDVCTQSTNNDNELYSIENETIKSSIRNNILYIILPILWLLGCIIGVVTFIIGNATLLGKINRAQTIRDDRINNILINCKKRLKINKKIKIKLQNYNQSPCIYGLIHPKILVSKELLKKDDEIIENVLMHELSHYKRKDMITNYILLLATSLHWFNPFVYFLFKRTRQEIELATDEVALNKMNKEEKKQYGWTLLNLLEIYENKRVATKILCITDDNKNMEKRIKKIKLSTKLKKYKVSILILAIIIVACIVSPFVIKPMMNSQKSNKIEGEWKPFKAEYNGENISLTQIYGSGISTYGGTLTFKEDGTYTAFIGIYSEDMINDLQGQYEISKDNIYLTTNNGNTQNLKYINNSNEILIREKIDDGTYVYFKKVENVSVEQDGQTTMSDGINRTAIKAGEHTLQYGIYKSDIDEGKMLGGTYELKSDGTFIYKNTWMPEGVNQEVIDDTTGTYEVYYSEDKDINTWIIQFNNLTGKESGGFVAFDIVGDNKFSARQYGNTFTRVENLVIDAN